MLMLAEYDKEEKILVWQQKAERRIRSRRIDKQKFR